MPHQLRSRRSSDYWPAALLLFVVSIPTVSLVWLVAVAMENQQLIIKQELNDAHRIYLQTARQQIQWHWSELIDEVEAIAADHPSAATDAVFTEIIRQTPVTAVLVTDPESLASYPNFDAPTTPDLGSEWRMARDREHQSGDPKSAYGLYVQLEKNATVPRERWAAVQGQLRCLMKSGDADRVREYLETFVRDSAVTAASGTATQDAAPDTFSMSILANLLLMAIEKGASDAVRSQAAEQLASIVMHYERYPLPAPQRLFLMSQLSRFAPDMVDASLLRAEQLASEYLVQLQPGTDASITPNETASRKLFQLKIPEGIWCCIASEGRLHLLFDEASIRQLITAGLQDHPNDGSLVVRSPSQQIADHSQLSLSMGDFLPGWQLGWQTRDSHELDQTVAARNRLYLWAGILTTLLTLAMALWVAGLFRRQMRLANLKNDLVGTVSHELKTPLASMRLLVDSLLHNETMDKQHQTEYLTLIAQENERLSRLIDNFLTFSRLSKSTPEDRAVQLAPRTIADRALEAIRPRLRDDETHLTVHMEHNLPEVVGDLEALVTVLVNLLDNAIKYTQPIREISFGVCATQDHVRFVVTDNGIGIPASAKTKIFQQFFQVDSQLSSGHGGCGLGLSIAAEIIANHHGELTVDSEPGKGSVFTVRLPAAGAPPAAHSTIEKSE